MMSGDVSMMKWMHLAQAAGVSLLLCSFAERPALGAPLRVRAVPEFQGLRTQPTADGGYQLIGYLRDAADQPLAGLVVQLLEPAGRPCDPTANATGADGEFCFRLDAPTGSSVVLQTLPSDYLDSAATTTTLDPAQAPQLNLSLTLPPELDLSTATHELVVALEGSVGSEAHPVHVTLTDPEREAPRFEQTVSVSRQRPTTLELAAAKLGPAGPASLNAELTISGHRLASARRAVTLVDTVELTLDHPVEPVRPMQGFELAVSAVGVGGPVQSGWVEATVGETQVGTARVAGGRAAVEIRFQAPRRERVPLSLRYVPEEPWYRPGESLSVSLAILPLPLWAHLPWVLLAALAGFWIIRAWRRPRRRREPESSKVRPAGRPEAVLVRALPSGHAWTGQVVDAHDGEVIAGARLHIEVPGIEAARSLSAAVADEAGRFELARVESPVEAARLVVRASEYSELRQQLPPVGEIRVSLVLRRRSLLIALTRWAREMGRPWAGASEPTPAHVAEVAKEQERPETRDWAEAVERAAYGESSPNEQTESILTSRTPPLDRASPHKR